METFIKEELASVLDGNAGLAETAYNGLRGFFGSEVKPNDIGCSDFREWFEYNDEESFWQLYDYANDESPYAGCDYLFFKLETTYINSYSEVKHDLTNAVFKVDDWVETELNGKRGKYMVEAVIKYNDEFYYFFEDPYEGNGLICLSEEELRNND